ncbi:signal peptidase II [Candidatus Pelagibacter bacterium]|nr:signal peptidase II [Candidatus Pelagibacter bacterium]
MNKIEFKKISLNLLILILIFFIDRLTKIYILNLAEIENSVDIYITPYLNLYLVWNKGIAFGLFSMNESIFYNLITFTIGIIILIIFYMIFKKNNIQRYFLLLIAGGAMGNFYDRLIYTAVPDFIDLHFYGYHWFVFNIADIFISIGVFCLILDELFFYKKS